MTRWNNLQRGHRGDDTEDLINYTNEFYQANSLALVTKIPTPIKVIEREKGIITKAFFEQKSTVDYQGICQGYSICFDAKETQKLYLPLSNIHIHQLEYMKAFSLQGGFSFLIVHFKSENKFFFLTLEFVCEFFENAKKGFRKSIPISSFKDEYEIKKTNSGILDYLTPLNRYIISKNE